MYNLYEPGGREAARASVPATEMDAPTDTAAAASTEYMAKTVADAEGEVTRAVASAATVTGTAPSKFE